MQNSINRLLNPIQIQDCNDLAGMESCGVKGLEMLHVIADGNCL
jgi:hypothetical protein